MYYTCCGIVLQHTYVLCCGAWCCMLCYTLHSHCNPYTPSCGIVLQHTYVLCCGAWCCMLCYTLHSHVHTLSPPPHICKPNCCPVEKKLHVSLARVADYKCLHSQYQTDHTPVDTTLQSTTLTYSLIPRGLICALRLHTLRHNKRFIGKRT